MSAQAWLAHEKAISLSGDINFKSAMTLDHQVKLLLETHGGGHWTIDMAGVLSVNSVALSLLLSWMRDLRARDGELTLIAMPVELMDLARVCGVDEFLKTR